MILAILIFVILAFNLIAIFLFFAIQAFNYIAFLILAILTLNLLATLTFAIFFSLEFLFPFIKYYTMVSNLLGFVFLTIYRQHFDSLPSTKTGASLEIHVLKRNVMVYSRLLNLVFLILFR